MPILIHQLTLMPVPGDGIGQGITESVGAQRSALDPVTRITPTDIPLDAWRTNFEIKVYSLVTAPKSAAPSLSASPNGGQVVSRGGIPTTRAISLNSSLLCIYALISCERYWRKIQNEAGEQYPLLLGRTARDAFLFLFSGQRTDRRA